MAITKRTALITGCSDGGLGAALALALQQADFHVFATVRNPAKAVSILEQQHNGSGTIEVLQLDVTSAQSIQDCAALVRSKTAGKLDVLVNNAGMVTLSPLLDANIAQGRKTFDVNVWGLLAVTQAFSEMIIRAQGAILNISSIAGAAKMAWQGIYNASKASTTWLSETLRIEMEPLGVRVITAMVGEVETNIYANANNEPFKLPSNSYYRCVESFIQDQAAGKLQTQNEPVQITARNLVKDVLSGKSGQIWRGGVAGTARLALWLLPGRLFEWMMHSNRGVYKVVPPVC
ncbi:putative short-chain dehydrogenase/reductase [Aspergillus falconensis]